MTGPQLYWTVRFAIGMSILLAAGLGAPSGAVSALIAAGGHVVADVLVGLAGFGLAFRSIGPLVRSLSDDAQLRRDWGGKRQRAFAEATTPQQVYQLLLCVATADGRHEDAERQLVRQFLQSRFPDPITHQQLRAWEQQAARGGDPKALARSVGRGLDPGERGTLYSWCCMIALSDRDFGVDERSVLDQVARGLGIHPDEARLLFLFAHQVLRGAEQGQRAHGSARQHGNQNGDGRQRGGQGGDRGSDRRGGSGPTGGRTPPRSGLAAERQRALTTLDLPADASPEQIRKRHRELVRRFHPDRHAHLGRVALDEATERFRHIQRAYELLTR